MDLDFTQQAEDFARSLIGYELTIHDDKGVRGGIIIETEAYAANDPASHSYGKRTARNEPMFSRPGTIYVYKIYGMHHCLNVVCGNYDGQAVLIRALEPTKGIEFMQQQRRTTILSNLSSGPAKLVEALGIEPNINSLHLDHTTLKLSMTDVAYSVATSPRIGISKAKEIPWRFVAQKTS